jgi:integrase
VTENRAGYYVELRRVKTGKPVSCLIQKDLGSRFHALEGQTPFWTGNSDLHHLTANWRKIYTKIFESAGIPDGHPHRFRHTTAKRLLVKGVSAGFVASVLGDSEEIVRKHYSKWISERQEALDRAIQATWSG